ncbi:hypothetical protein MWU49_15390 [Alcanivorax sp. S6407]|uniref:hypothetical protein n=1 Tax=Alcanivorax sp. S6407 TaxID=2926424 RepID=UPI001FF5D978|nr:hypothetical protein [Alcanivorax sp. S6407]MCK0155097.1 hypothetical protein [Alcanivorax sp. S6407]
MPDNRPHNHNDHHDDVDESTADGGRKIEREKWALLGLALLVAGAVVLGMLTHAESLEVRNAMKDIRIMIDDGLSESGES